jgi:hypothetical protein
MTCSTPIRDTSSALLHHTKLAPLLTELSSAASYHTKPVSHFTEGTLSAALHHTSPALYLTEMLTQQPPPAPHLEEELPQQHYIRRILEGHFLSSTATCLT